MLTQLGGTLLLRVRVLLLGGWGVRFVTLLLRPPPHPAFSLADIRTRVEKRPALATMNVGPPPGIPCPTRQPRSWADKNIRQKSRTHSHAFVNKHLLGALRPAGQTVVLGPPQTQVPTNPVSPTVHADDWPRYPPVATARARCGLFLLFAVSNPVGIWGNRLGTCVVACMTGAPPSGVRSVCRGRQDGEALRVEQLGDEAAWRVPWR